MLPQATTISLSTLKNCRHAISFLPIYLTKSQFSGMASFFSAYLCATSGNRSYWGVHWVRNCQASVYHWLTLPKLATCQNGNIVDDDGVVLVITSGRQCATKNLRNFLHIYFQNFDTRFKCPQMSNLSAICCRSPLLSANLQSMSTSSNSR